MTGRAAALAMAVATIARTGAFNLRSVPEAAPVQDTRRRELVGAVLATVAINPLQAGAANQQSFSGIRDPRLRGCRIDSFPNWQGTALPGPLTLSEAYLQVRGVDPQQSVLNMGRWPDPILRHNASPIPASIFRDEMKLEQLRVVASALKNTARLEGAVGLAAQQCGLDASLVFIDGGTNDAGIGRRERDVTDEGRRKQHFREEGLFLVNPRIIQRSPESEMLVWTEECLVLPPEFRATLLRDEQVTIEYESLDCIDGGSVSCGSTRQITLRGELARCAQHEMDHDRGVLIVDHVPTDELLPGMADVENADRLHQNRMQVAYSREVSDSSLLPSDAKMVQLAMEDKAGFRSKVKHLGDEYGYDQRTHPWFVQPANAVDRDCREQRDQHRCHVWQSGGRIVEERRAMMKQSRSNTRRADVLELSQQRASMYGTEFKGLPPQTCAQPGFCP
ncbi:hypothetical protein ACHAXT_002930 [Thalassiosira profunda]